MSDASALHVSVAVPIPVRRLFTYKVPAELTDSVAPGVRVRVPFARRKLVATVVECPVRQPGPEVRTLAIDAVVEERRRLPAEILELTRFVSEYYLCSWGDAIEAALPPDPGPPRSELWVRCVSGRVKDSLPVRAVARRRVLESIAADGSWVRVSSVQGINRRTLREMVRDGWVEQVQRPISEQRPTPVTPHFEERSTPQPTSEQAQVLEELYPLLEQRTFAPCLLFGATGSGKTEVFFRAARRCLESGRSVLYLVPEIGLTPLLMSQVRERFGEGVALLHSGLSRSQRFAAWDSLRRGETRLVVGTRSAIFAPMVDPGLIVVDEEQDSSYKQEESPRYNARDLAIVRARDAQAVVLLGSATPSMESFQHARAGRYRLLRLGGRVHRRPLPRVTLVDMREEFRRQGQVTALSGELSERLRSCVARGEQALVLRNRRGWSAAITCVTCGNRIGCTKCSIAMTWHRSAARLRCHYCGLEQDRPPACPTCGSAELILLGEGSEQIEQLIRDAVPGAVVERMDRDTIRRRGAHETLLKRFQKGEIQILVGTQMIAKGHDFPRVTLVGVLSADQPLGMPDFRAGERVFQLLTQVSGRAGRGELPGTVVIQAFDVEHPLLAQAATQDFEAFFDREIHYRRALRYPPLSALVQLIVHDRDSASARLWSGRLAEALRAESRGRLIVFGPGPAPLERLKDRWRQQILVRAAGRRRLIQAVERALEAVEGQVPHRALQVDVDPYSLL